MKLNPILLHYATPPILIGSVGFGVISGICGIGFSWQLSQWIPSAFITGLAHPHFQSIGLLIGLLVLRFFFSTGQSFFSSKHASTAKSKIRLHMLKQGSLEPTTLMRGVEALDPWYAQYLPQLFLAVILPFSILCIAFWVDFWSGLVFLVSAPLLPIFLSLIGMGARVKQQKQWKLLLQQGNLYRETLIGLTTLKLFGKSKEWGQTLARSAESLRSATLEVLRIAFLSALVLELVGTIGTAILAVQLGIRLLHGDISYPLALFLLLLAPEFYLPLRQLGLRAHAAMEGDAVAETLFKESKENIANLAYEEPGPGRLLNVQNVSARWPQQEHPAFENCSFSISSKEFLGITGPSGCGKSTLFACIMGILKPTSGTIQMSKGIHIIWVPQHPQIYHRSLRDNILQYPGSSTQNDPQIWNALGKVGLADFVKSLPQGLSTSVGEKGARLSGGQLRRLALARAFLTPCDLILMDEPDAHLDEASLLMLEDLVCSMDFTARIVISHREQTLSKTNHILHLGKT